MMPIKRSVFEKLLFCDSIFEMVELEESLYFTQLDLLFHSFPNLTTGEELHKHNQACFARMQINQQEKEIVPSQPLSHTEVMKLVENQENRAEELSECYKTLSNILFSPAS